MDSFDIDEYFMFDEFDLSREQTEFELGPLQSHSSQVGSSSLHLQAETHLRNEIDGRCPLPEMPPCNPFMTPTLVEFPSEPENRGQYDLGELAQEHCHLSDKQEPSLYEQAMSDSYNHLEAPPFDSNTLHPTCSQQDFQQSEPNCSLDGVLSGDPADPDHNQWADLLPCPQIAERSASSRMTLGCNWPSCIRSRFGTRGDLYSHQMIHFSELSEQWEKPSGCSWHGCQSQKSGKVFRTRGDYRRHLRKHIKTHWCDQDGCTYNKPFGTRHDLRRHIQTAHSDVRSFYCPIDSCPNSTLGFSRKDKLDDHTKKEHDNFQCIFDHCKALVMEHERDDHLKKFHSGKALPHASYPRDGKFECVLTGCKSTKSVFNCTSARRHLQTHHGLSFDASEIIVFDAETYSVELDVFIIMTDRPHQSCKMCLKKRGVTGGTHQVATLNSNS